MREGLYIHIPFCSSKCAYCDFLSACGNEAHYEAYCDALIEEIKAYKPAFPIDTVFIGGGTPTVLPKTLLERLLKALPPLAPNAEFTCEANPGTLDKAKIKVLTAGGVNRISLGLQAWQDNLLKNIGRKSTLDDFLQTYHLLQDMGVENISVDLMFALPEQSMDDWKESLQNVVALKPKHISAYALTLEEDTHLPFEAFDEKLDREMYQFCKTYLSANGYMQYELSNFCKAGFLSKHNLRYWELSPYKGFGLGAHSYMEGMRFHNSTDLQEYIKNNEKKDVIKLSKADMMSEFMFLGLRKTKGVAFDDFYKKFDVNAYELYKIWIDKMAAEGYISKLKDCISLTDKGMDFANYVMAGFL